MPFKKGHQKIGGRKKGTPNKNRAAFKDRLDELNCDPQHFLAMVMTGQEESLGQHPFYTYLLEIQEEIQSNKRRKHPTPTQWNALMSKAKATLKFKEASLPERINVAQSLLPYIAPKLRVVEHSGSIDTPDLAGLASGAREILKAKLGTIKKPTDTDEMEKG